MTATAFRTEHPTHPRDAQPLDTVVEQAKGVLMLRYGIGSYESLATLAQWSHDAHLSLPEISRALVKGICQGHSGPSERGVVRWLEHRLREEVPGRDAPVSVRPSSPVRTETVTITQEVAMPTEEVAAPIDEAAAPTEPARDRTEQVEGPRSEPEDAPRKRWRYASAVHAARALHRR